MMNSFRNKSSHEAKNSFWKTTQEAESIYWEKRCSDAIGVFYEMGEHLDLPSRIQDILKETPNSFLDVGIGPMGVGLLWMYPETKIRIGIDSLPRAEVSTANHYADNLVEEIHNDTLYIRGRGEELPFDSNSFELVVCNNVLDHVSGPFHVLDEICRVTKKGGYIGIGLDTNSKLGSFLRKIDRRFRFHLNTYKLHPYDFTIGEIEAFFRKKGFDILYVNSASFLGGIVGRRRMQSWVAIKTA